MFYHLKCLKISGAKTEFREFIFMKVPFHATPCHSQLPHNNTNYRLCILGLLTMRTRAVAGSR